MRKIVIVDEPTTLLSTGNRRHVPLHPQDPGRPGPGSATMTR
jgi:hypothetical protein